MWGLSFSRCVWGVGIFVFLFDFYFEFLVVILGVFVFLEVGEVLIVGFLFVGIGGVEGGEGVGEVLRGVSFKRS